MHKTTNSWIKTTFQLMAEVPRSEGTLVAKATTNQNPLALVT